MEKKMKKNIDFTWTSQKEKELITLLTDACIDQLETDEPLDIDKILLQKGFPMTLQIEGRLKCLEIKLLQDYLGDIQLNIIKNKILDGKLPLQTGKYFLDISGNDKFKTREQMLRETYLESRI